MQSLLQVSSGQIDDFKQTQASRGVQTTPSHPSTTNASRRKDSSRRRP
jgi:hypothetical protein